MHTRARACVRVQSSQALVLRADLINRYIYECIVRPQIEAADHRERGGGERQWKRRETLTHTHTRPPLELTTQ